MGRTISNGSNSYSKVNTGRIVAHNTNHEKNNREALLQNIINED